MSRARFLPYRTVGEGDIAWGGWWLERDGIREPLPDLLPGWDYASADSVGLTAEIDGGRVLAATGHDSLEQLEVVVIVDCPSMLRRFVARRRLASVPQERVELAVELPPGAVAQKLNVSAYLLLAADADPKPRTATRRGSRLAAGPARTVLLEGDASRFPTEAVSFSELRYEDAPWTISAVFDGLTDSFMGSVRLLINEDHELGRAVLAQPVDPQLEARLKLEVLRSLIALMSAQGLGDETEFPPDSVGEVVDSMSRLFLNRSVSDAVQMYERNPLKFDRLLHAGVGA